MISSGRPAAGGPDAQACICKDSGTGQSVAQHCATRMPARRPQAKCSLCAAISAESPLEIRNERRLESALLLTSPVTQHEDVIDRGGPRRAGRLGGLSLSAEGHAGWPAACRCRGCPGQAGGRARHADRRAERAAARRRVLSTSRAGRRSARIQFAMTRAFWSPLTGNVRAVWTKNRSGWSPRPAAPQFRSATAPAARMPGHRAGGAADTAVSPRPAKRRCGHRRPADIGPGRCRGFLADPAWQ